MLFRSDHTIDVAIGSGAAHRYHWIEVKDLATTDGFPTTRFTKDVTIAGEQWHGIGESDSDGPGATGFDSRGTDDANPYGDLVGPEMQRPGAATRHRMVDRRHRGEVSIEFASEVPVSRSHDHRPTSKRLMFDTREIEGHL